MHHKLITGSPVAVPDARVLSIDQIEDLPLEALLRALERMKLFFANMQKNNRFTQHNNLRITRMVKCLVLRGLRREANELVNAMIDTTENDKIARQFWVPAIDEAEEQVYYCQRMFQQQSGFHGCGCALLPGMDDAYEVCDYCDSK